MGGAPLSAPSSAPSTVNGGETTAHAVFDDATEVRIIRAPRIDRYKGPTFKDKVENIEFLSRPLPIAQGTWTSALTFLNYDLLTTYFSNASVVAKMRNVARLRATINVRVQVTGSPYSYGRLVAAYVPFPTAMTGVNHRNATMMTQMLGGMLDPSCNDVLQWEVPYHGVSDFWNTESPKTYVGPQGPYGELWLSTLNGPLTYGQAVASPVPFTVYMWLTDVEAQLATPLAFAVPEGRSEYGKGPVTRVATAVAAAARGLRDVPGIGAMALATEVGAGAAAAVAGLFGWSAPASLELRRPVRHSLFPPMSAVEDDTGFKLTTDPKSELSVDPSIVCGTDHDDMALSAIWSRPGLFGQFTWATTATVGAVLSNRNIHPGAVLTNGAAPLLYYITPVAFASLPFRYWRGSLIITVEVVASRFHTGRLGVSYVSSLGGGAIVDDLVLTAPTVVLDMSGTRTVRITVPYSASTPHKRVTLMPSTIGPAYVQQVDNGYLVFHVINQLSSTLATDTATVNLFIAAGADYGVEQPEINGPSMSDLCLFPAAAAFLCAGGLAGDVCEVSDVDIYGPVTVPPEISRVSFGQDFGSIRSLIKAYCPYLVTTSTANAVGNTVTYIDHPTYPFQGNTVSQSAGAGSYNPWTYYSWFCQAFLGVRGGTRWKLKFSDNNAYGVAYPGTAGQKFASLNADLSGSPCTVANGFTATVFNVQSFDVLREVPRIFGSCAQPYGEAEVVEFECPAQHPYRFTPGGSPCYFAYADGQSGSGVDRSGFRAGCVYSSSIAGGQFRDVIWYQAGSEDASFSWFVSAPPLYANAVRGNYYP